MTKVDKKIIDKIVKRVEKRLFPSRGTLFGLLLVALAIGIGSSYHGMSEAWAWEVAKVLISINGLLIGFNILGITVFLRRGYVSTLVKKGIEESVDSFVENFQDSGRNSKEINNEELFEELFINVADPFFDVVMLRMVFMLSMKTFLISIGLSLFLFGVTMDNLNIWYLKSLFLTSYQGAITSFIVGTWFIVHGISVILHKGTEINVKQSLELFKKVYEKKLKDLEKKAKKK